MSMYCYVVTIDLDTPIYLTDFHINQSYNGNEYIAGKLQITTSVTQKSEPSANDFTMTMSAVDQTLVSAFAGQHYKGRRCLVERLNLNEDGSIISSEVWLDGDCNKYLYTNALKQSTIKLTVSSIFGAFDSTQMVNLVTQFSDSINEDATLYWGKTAPTVTTTTTGTKSEDLNPTEKEN